MEQDNSGPWGRLVSSAITFKQSPYDKSADQQIRIKALKKFLKERDLDPEKLSDEQLLLLQEVFRYQTGDDVIKAYNEMTKEMKKGGSIYIKKKNRGKFTASAKAVGKGVQEYAHKVMNDPNATPLQKKRANFAIQAKKWHRKHQLGGKINYLDIFV